MKNGTARRSLVTRLHSLALIGFFIIVAAVVAVPIYSVRSGSVELGSVQKDSSVGAQSARVTRTKSITASNSILPPASSAFPSFLPVPQASPETMTTFAADCTTPKTSFALGDQVCAQTNFVSESDRFVNWFGPSGLAYGGAGTTDINPESQPQNFLFTPNSTGNWKVTIADPNDGSIVPTDFVVTSSEETVSIYAADCTTPKTSFQLSTATQPETVCAKVTNAPTATSVLRRFSWSVRAFATVQTTDVTTNTQTDTLTLPTTPINTVNGEAVDYRAVWRVCSVDSEASLHACGYFSVHDPAAPSADIEIRQSSNKSSSGVSADSDVQFTAYVRNNGPDAAAGVVVTNSTPNHTTFGSVTQPSGQGFDCTTTGGTTNCAATGNFAPNALATFTFTYHVIAGTAAETNISNEVTAAGTTSESQLDNNDSVFSVQVNGTAGASTDCSLTCPSDITKAADTTDGSGNPGAVVHYPSATSTGDCGTINYDHCNDCFFPVGTTVVNVSGNGDSCTFSVHVTSPEAPTITCPSDKTVGTASTDSNCEANVAVGTATTTGGHNVTVFSTRSDGKPMYTCDANGNCTRRSSDDPFPVGTTTITWTAYSHDVAGPYTTPGPNPGDTFEEQHRTGSASCTQKVTVYDTTPPVITATDSTVSADANCQATVPDYSNSASDNCACASSDNSENCAQHGRITVTQDPAAGTIVGPGDHPVHITANDGSITPGPDGVIGTSDDQQGNVTEKTVTFTVKDTTAPTITYCPPSQTVSTEPGTCAAHVVTGTATATDNCGATVTGTRSDGRPLTDTYPKGTTTITWKATDGAGNHTECTQTITVEDHENPVIVCPAPIVQGNDPGTCSATVNPGSPTASDNCGSPTVTGTRSDGQSMNAPYPKGTTTITWTATDSSGNHVSCTQTVTVVDNEGPTFTFTGTQTMWPPNHKYKTFAMTDLIASVHDNCDGTIPVSSVVITKVTSDEIENGNGDGNTTNDIVIAANCKSVQLRSEREGDGNGRVYTIFFSVTDAAGNKGTGTTKVVVPHNPGETAVDSGPHYTVNSNCP